MRKVETALLFLGLTASSLFVMGCSTKPIPNPPDEFRIHSADLFLSRTNLTDTDFEQFKVDGQKLFVECGKIRRGRFVPQQQQVFPVTDTELIELSDKAWHVSRFKEYSYDEPGDNSSMADPGQAYLTLGMQDTTLQVKTSLDAITSQSSLADTALYGLATNLRKLAGGTLCESKSFYGVR